jgi:hypothetical protein
MRRTRLVPLVTQAAYNLWKTNFGTVSPGTGAGSRSFTNASGTVPEPATLFLLWFLIANAVTRRTTFREPISIVLLGLVAPALALAVRR